MLSIMSVLCPSGGWPLVGINQTTPWNLNNQNGFLTEKLYGSPAFFTLGVFPGPRNSSRSLLTVNNLAYLWCWVTDLCFAILLQVIQSGLTIPAAALYEQEAITAIVSMQARYIYIYRGHSGQHLTLQLDKASNDVSTHSC